jgi:hypothetical protein
LGESRRYLVVMRVTVHDHEVLRTAAAEQAVQEGVTEAQWSSLRFGTAEDLAIFLDRPSDSDLGYEVDEMEIGFDRSENDWIN